MASTVIDRAQAVRSVGGGSGAAASRLLDLASSGTKIIVVLFLAVETIIGVSSLSDVREPIVTIVGLTLVITATIVGSLPGRYPMPFLSAFAVLAATTATALLIAPNLPADRDPGYAAWWVGASSFLFLLLALRGRARWAWVGMASISGIVILWSATSGPGILTGIDLAARNSATLLVGTLFAIGIARTADRLTAFGRTERENLAGTSAAEASLAERRSHVRRLRETTGVLLQRIAAGDGLSAEERRDCLVVEGALRDEARAPNLAIEPIAARVRALRRGGAQVILLDDRASTGLSDHDRAAIAGWLVEKLEAVAGGRVTVRILPPGRGILASIVVIESGITRLESLEG